MIFIFAIPGWFSANTNDRYDYSNMFNDVKFAFFNYQNVMCMCKLTVVSVCKPKWLIFKYYFKSLDYLMNWKYSVKSFGWSSIYLFSMQIFWHYYLTKKNLIISTSDNNISTFNS